MVFGGPNQAMESRAKTVLLADDHTMFREGWRSY